ncbi:hypothetical protein NQZ68_033423 [Dissostichus eleginoides]|nr:hypothetical protein NQZ68_033423 [Dissostichus eleginoides]
MGCASSIHISDRVVYQSGKESEDSHSPQQTNTTQQGNPASALPLKPPNCKRDGETARRLQCENDSKEVWECDVSLCQGYVTIWAALAMIRLKYKLQCDPVSPFLPRVSAGVEGGDLFLPCHLSPLGHEQTELRGSMMRPMQHTQSTDVLAALSLSAFDKLTGM